MKSVFDKLYHLKKALLDISFSEGSKVLYKAEDGWKEGEIKQKLSDDIYIVKVDNTLIKTNKLIPYPTEEVLFQIIQQLINKLNIEMVLHETININTGEKQVSLLYKAGEEEEYSLFDYVMKDKKSAYYLIIDLLYAVIFSFDKGEVSYEAESVHMGDRDTR